LRGNHSISNSRICNSQETTNTFRPLQPSYVAPEILKKEPYDQKCDLWSCGVVLYSLLCGYTPFADDNQEKMFDRVKQGDFSFDPEDWAHISQGAKDLIKALLVVNPDERLSAAAALRSTWITQDEKSLSDRDLSQTVAEIKKRRPRLRDLARAFMSVNIVKKMSLKSIPSREASPETSSEDSAIQIV
jgi:calcium-dependent protein kinase